MRNILVALLLLPIIARAQTPIYQGRPDVWTQARGMMGADSGIVITPSDTFAHNRPAGTIRLNAGDYRMYIFNGSWWNPASSTLDSMDVLGLMTWSNIQDKPATFPPQSHTHPITQITDLQDSLNKKVSLQATIGTPEPGNINISGSGQARRYNSDTITISRQSAFSITDTFTFIGDSWTKGNGSTNGGYVGQFALLSGATVINKGLAGSTMQYGTPPNPFAGESQALENRLGDIPVKRPGLKYLISQALLNDFGYNGGNYDTVGAKAAMRVWVNNAISKGWSTNEILFIGPGYANATGYAAYAALSGNPAPNVIRHLQYVDAARKACQEYPGLRFIDLYEFMRSNGGNALLSGDGFHPNNTGAVLIANYLYNMLNGSGYMYNPGQTVLAGETNVSKMVIAAQPTGSLSPSLRFGITNDTTAARIPGSVEFKRDKVYVTDSFGVKWEAFLVPLGYRTKDTSQLIWNNATATAQSAAINVTGNVISGGSVLAGGSAGVLTVGTNSPSGRAFFQMQTAGQTDDIEFNTVPANNYGRIWFRSAATDHAWILWPGSSYAGSGLFQAGGFNFSNRKSGGPLTLNTTGTGIINLAPGGDNLSNIKLTATTTGVGIGTTSPNASAALQINSTTQGFVPSRMTAAQASAIASPQESLIIYVTDTNGTFTSKGWWGFNGSAWEKLNN